MKKHSYIWFLYRITSVIFLVVLSQTLYYFVAAYMYATQFVNLFDFFLSVKIVFQSSTTLTIYMYLLVFIGTFHIYYGLEEIIVDYIPNISIQQFTLFCLRIILVSGIYQIISLFTTY